MKHRLQRIAPALLFALSAQAAESAAQTQLGMRAPEESVPSRSLVLKPATSPIRIDGVLDDPAWQDAALLRLNYEAFPGDNTTPPVNTECRVSFDPVNLYVACVAEDPDPARIRANFTDRDRALADDHILVLLDPFGDRRRAFQFRVNPVGVQMDALFTHDSEDFSWDAIWSSAGRITESGYVVELAIPFRSLRFPRTPEVQEWGILIERSYPRTARHRIRSVPTIRGEPCLLCQAGTLTGLHGIAPGRDVELTPTLTAARTDRRLTPADAALAPGAAETDLGLSLRWGLTPNVSLLATLNPDFSQVEADVTQLTVNQRFAITYPEKRPFFLDGADVFQTFVNAVATRTVVDPLAGAKLTGKQGPHAVGSFLARDRVNALILPANQRTSAALLNDAVSTGVVRYAYDFGRSSTLGGLLTLRHGEEYRNEVGAVDGLIRLAPTLTYRSQLLVSRTEYPREVAERHSQPVGPFNGFSQVHQLSRNTRHWNMLGQFQELSPDLRLDAGHLPRVDVRVLRTNVQRVFWGESGGWYNRFHVNLLAERLTTIEGALSDQGVALSANYQGPLQSQVQVGRYRFRRAFAGQTFDLAGTDFFAESRPGRLLSTRFSGRFGDEIDFANARAARTLELQPSVDLRPNRNLELGFGYSMQRLALPRGGERILSADLVQSRLVYNFSTRMFVRGLVQYQDVRRNPDLNAASARPAETRMASQLLFSYKMNPQSVAFIGYSDNQFGEREFELARQDRTFFFKLGYAWRM